MGWGLLSCCAGIGRFVRMPAASSGATPSHPPIPPTPSSPLLHGSWVRACQTIFLRSRTSAIKRSLLGDASPLDAVVFGAPFGLAGPQARLKFNSTPASRFHPAAAEITAEVGLLPAGSFGAAAGQLAVRGSAVLRLAASGGSSAAAIHSDACTLDAPLDAHLPFAAPPPPLPVCTPAGGSDAGVRADQAAGRWLVGWLVGEVGVDARLVSDAAMAYPCLASIPLPPLVQPAPLPLPSQHIQSLPYTLTPPTPPAPSTRPP